MSPDDPRHGTGAGYSAHWSDGERPCFACLVARSRYSEEARRLKAYGRWEPFVDAEPARSRVRELMAGGMSIVRISKASGYKPARISYLLYGSGVKPVPKRIRPAFADAVMGVEPETAKVDSLATSRRLQALSASGYTMPSLAKRLGVSKSRVEQLANRRSPFVMRSTHLAVAALYGELSMVVPVGKTRGERQGISHAKSTAAAKGWLPPLAWNDIDDPDEQPTDWEYRPPTRAELIADLDEQGAGITDVCKALGVTQKTFERWCVRHDEWDRFKRIRDRERPSEAA